MRSGESAAHGLTTSRMCVAVLFELWVETPVMENSKKQFRNPRASYLRQRGKRTTPSRRKESGAERHPSPCSRTGKLDTSAGRDARANRFLELPEESLT